LTASSETLVESLQINPIDIQDVYRILQENPIFHGKIDGFRLRFSLKPLIEE
jgi:hypothetical protein